MKKMFLFCALNFALSTSVSAQQWAGSSDLNNFITRNGDIRLHDNTSFRAALGPAWGDANIGYGTAYLGFNLARNNHSDGLWTFNSNSAANGANVIYGNIFGDLLFSIKPSSGVASGTLTDRDIAKNVKMRILRDGKVRIGDTEFLSTPGDYKLYVEKGILTERVKVAVNTTADWADYVFTKEYKLMTLKEVERYIKENNHLPDVPSANEMVKKGLDVAEMDAKLLQKIEELTLYMIELKKENEMMHKKIEAIEQKK